MNSSDETSKRLSEFFKKVYTDDPVVPLEEKLREIRKANEKQLNGDETRLEDSAIRELSEIFRRVYAETVVTEDDLQWEAFMSREYENYESE